MIGLYRTDKMDIHHRRFINMDELMMQALLTAPSSRSSCAGRPLNPTRAPDERALFESMLQTEALLRNLPVG